MSVSCSNCKFDPNGTAVQLQPVATTNNSTKSNSLPWQFWVILVVGILIVLFMIWAGWYGWKINNGFRYEPPLTMY